MVMRIGRTLPPAASPIRFMDIMSGVSGLLGGVNAVRKFEDALKTFYGVRHCFAVSSGKAALALILQALKELSPEKDEVLIPAYTCYSVPSAIVKAGLKVRLCDLAPGTLDFDFELIGAQLTNPRLLCIIPTHLFGLPANMERLKKLVKQRDIFIVEDAAQAMCSDVKLEKTGTSGDVGLFSLGRGKAFSTVEGGIILTDNDRIGAVIERLLTSVDGYGIAGCMKLVLFTFALSILIHPRFFWLPKSLPLLKLGETHFNPCFPIRRLSSFQAGLAKRWQKRLERLASIRTENAQKIRALGIAPFGASSEMVPALIRFPVLVSNAEIKKKILQKSEQMGKGISDVYPDSIDGIVGLNYLPDSASFPVAKDISKRIISLPVHPYVRGCDVRQIVQLTLSTSSFYGQE